ncbi:hypothetical protein H072_3913 [Dactylellina haptotyla CBS 200.50]|uniref:Uncharacterized protein n=1 Tax=Dactylellina haptotyla (strain CBS 200.50) TaxID=1284197 RepID=S8ALS7_DACHA|nr:hypothetical protein H072_3913 [Dactylellina haptotyla CBS 200.50]
MAVDSPSDLSWDTTNLVVTPQAPSISRVVKSDNFGLSYSFSATLSTVYLASTRTLTAFTTATETVTRDVDVTFTETPNAETNSPEPSWASEYSQSYKHLKLPIADASFISSVTNATTITNAIFSRKAVIVWSSLFAAFLLFAGVVFGLQKVMRRIRARRWIKEHASGILEMDQNNGGVSSGVAGGNTTIGSTQTSQAGSCAFIDGSDLSFRMDDGVDGRTGSWSRRRDGKMKRGGRTRKSPVKPKMIKEEV